MKAHNVDDIIEMLNTVAPGLWDLCYPRVYENLGKFSSAKLPAATIANAVIGARKHGLSHAAVRNEYVIATKCLEHAVPTFFVTSDMLRAADATTLPPELRWTEIQFPHSGMVFVFERGAVSHTEDGDIGFVCVARTKAGDRIGCSYPDAPHGTMREGGLLMMTGAYSTENINHYDLSMSDVESPTIQDMDKVMLKEYDRPIGTMEFDQELSVGAKEFNRWITQLAIKLVLIMLARPEQVSRGGLMRTVKPKRKGERAVEFWSPNVIGRNYRSDREPGEAHTADAEGKVRMHWRRGHFTQQPYGPAHTLRKTMWREPVLVGNS